VALGRAALEVIGPLLRLLLCSFGGFKLIGGECLRAARRVAWITTAVVTACDVNWGRCGGRWPVGHDNPSTGLKWPIGQQSVASHDLAQTLLSGCEDVGTALDHWEVLREFLIKLCFGVHAVDANLSRNFFIAALKGFAVLEIFHLDLPPWHAVILGFSGATSVAVHTFKKSRLLALGCGLGCTALRRLKSKTRPYVWPDHVAVPDFHDLCSISIHEAGHCTVAARLGLPVTKIEIIGRGDLLDGYTHADATRAGLVNWIAVLLAGNFAEEALLGYRAASRPHAGNDEERIADAITRTTHSQQVKAMAEQKSRMMVRSHRPTIAALAGALLDRALGAGAPWEPFEISISGDELAILLGATETALLLRRAAV
jgi:hypothetical protein